MSNSEINDKTMKNTLSQFVNGDLCSATLGLLKELSIQYTRGAQNSLPKEELFKGKSISPTTKDALDLVTNTYFAALIDNKTFDKSREDVDLDSALTEAKAEKYNGMFVFAIDVKTDVTIKRKRTVFATLTRAFNKLAYDKPLILLIRQAEILSIATCERIDRKRDSGEKMGKVNLLQGINCSKPATGHLRILENLQINPKIRTFDALYEHWFEVFNTKTLTDKFYKELYSWYMWVVNDPNTHFPENDHLPEHENEKKNVKIIRLITRLLFVWFIKAKKVKKEGQFEMGLVPEKLFEIDELKAILNDFDPNSATDGEYYNAILQNLFFATLNNEVNSRQFVDTSNAYRSKKGYTVKNLYRDNKDKSGSWFKISHDEVLDLFKTVPFLNCGLFECLDKYKRTDINYDVDRIFDGFSTKSGDKFRACLPNRLFFADELPEITIQVTEKGKKVPLTIKSKGLINLLNEYVFTVEENTPLDQQVSLDPELLGKVFENLLAAYNPETEESARKSSGSYYTPREIVEYMVNESLIQYLKTNLNADEATEAQLRNLVNPSNPDFKLSSSQQDAILEALYHCRILDPACGSGAFPMGMLQQMVHIISRLDDKNEKWQKLITKKATEETAKAYENKELNDEERKKIIADIESSFTNSKNNPDYTRKLYLIQNCIFGVDIQPIAMMISKLRFFISLICEQDENAINFDDVKQNFGIHTLPNLETKFVAANSLLTPDLKKFTGDWTNDEHLDQLKDELMELRYRHVTARSLKDKMEIRTLDDEKRQEINDYILSTQAHADPVKIAMFEDQIAHLMLERKLYEGENIVEEYVNVQGDLFADSERKLVRKDANRTKRDEIDRQIHICQAQIDHEKAKENITGFEAAVKQLTEWNPYDQVKSSPFFDPDWMFGITGGFDIVIGNPPYVSVKAISAEDKAIYSNRFITGKGRFNLFTLFIEMFYEVSCLNGTFCLIIPEGIYSNIEYRYSRELLIQQCRINRLCTFTERVFDASVDTTILIISKKQEKNEQVKIDTDILQTKRSLNQNNLEKIPYYLIPVKLEGNDKLLVEKLLLSPEFNRIGKIMEIQQGIIYTGQAKEDVFADYIKDSTYKPILDGRDIVKWRINWDIKEYDKYLSYTNKLHRAREERLFLAEKKILLPRRATKIVATIDYEQYYALNTAYICLNKKEDEYNTEFLLGVLNSKLVDYYYSMLFFGWQITIPALEVIPIPICDKEKQLKVSCLAKNAIDVKQPNLLADSNKIEEEIDQWVYALYGLTYEEVLIVDPNFSLKKEAYEKLLAEK